MFEGVRNYKKFGTTSLEQSGKVFQISGELGFFLNKLLQTGCSCASE